MRNTGHEASRARIAARRAVLVSVVAVSLTACSPTVSLYGVYVPGWLAAGLGGCILSYLIVGFLARFGASRPLGDSGVFFCSLGAILAYVLWFTFFARY